MKKVLIFFLSSIVFCANLFSQINVISPEPGTWSNKQMLVIDTQKGGEYFYSLDGNDPEKFGFAYDGPVLIDLTGDVNIRIKKAGKNSVEKVIKYNVTPNQASNSDYFQFIQTFYDTGIINYTAGSELFIPEELYYLIGPSSQNYIKGKILTISENNVLSRCIPIEIYDKKTELKWRFIVKTFPRSAGVYSKREVPFYITDWNTITFTNQNYIYRIDSQWWGLPKDSVKIDRKVPHTIYWQNLEYEYGNPIESIVLPAKPQIKTVKNQDYSLDFVIDGDDSYLMSVLSYNEKEYQELFTVLGVDTFFGDDIKGSLEVGLFSNSIYQGTIKVPYNVLKRPPADPFISTTCKEFYSRRPVNCIINCEKDVDLYVSITGPYVINDLAESYSPNSYIFESVPVSEYKKVDTHNYKFSLIPNEEGASYFKVMAYTKHNDITSSISEYKVLIDQYNYYYDESSKAENPDGTPDRPYTNFKDCMESINNGRYALVRIRGTVTIPSGETEVFSNCKLLNVGDGEFLFAKDSSLVVNGSSIIMEGFNLLMQNDDYVNSDKLKSMFKLKNSMLDLKNCQVACNYGNKANFVDGYNSTIIINDCVISVNANNYASCFSGVKVRPTINNSIIYASASTCVIFSLDNAQISIKKNSFKVSGQMGRIAEFFNVRGNLENNTYKSEVQNKNIQPVYTDKKCKITDVGNNSSEF